MRYEFRIAIRYKLFLYCDIPIYQYIVTPLLDRKQNLNVLYQVCVFHANQKNKMAAQPLIGWDIFEFSSETAERNLMKFDRKQNLNILYQVFFSGQSEKQDGSPSLWLAKTFLTSPLKLLNRILLNLTDRKNSMYSTKFVFFRWSDKQDHHQWVPRPLIGLENFDFSSELLNWIWLNLTGSKISTSSTKFVFLAYWKFMSRWLPRRLSWLRLFRRLLRNPWMEFNEIWLKAISLSLLPNLSFFWPIRKPRWPPRPLIGQDIFDFSSETAEWNSMKLDRKHDLNVLYQVEVFWADWKTKMATKANQSTRVAHCTQVEIQDGHPNFDWPRHFRRIWNHWMQFNET